MKNSVIPGLLLAAAAFISACNNNAGIETKSSLNDDKAINEKLAPGTGSCCFMSTDEANRFFPAGSAEIPAADNQPASGNLQCTQDGETESSLSKSYLNGNGRLVLKLSDYCVNPRRLELDYNRRYTNTLKIFGEDKVEKELADPSGRYSGFTVFSAKNKSSYLVAVVDKRFGVTISGVDQVNGDDIVRLFNMIPLDELAGYGK